LLDLTSPPFPVREKPWYNATGIQSLSENPGKATSSATPGNPARSPQWSGLLLPDGHTLEGWNAGHMPILRDIPISLTADQILASRGTTSIRPELKQSAEEAIALGHLLWQPAALYDWFDVCHRQGESVHLAIPHQPGGEIVLRVGPKADLLDHAQRILASVITIGPALEQKVHELQTAREGLKAYLLDTTGVVALGAVGGAVRCLAEEAAADLGWGVSPSLSPGSLAGWPVSGQRELCALLPLDSIGVELNSHSVLIPFKSASAIIGLGPGYETAKVGSVCKYCALKNTCWRRREDRP
jgi:hypothetical protein